MDGNSDNDDTVEGIVFCIVIAAGCAATGIYLGLTAWLAVQGTGL